MTPDEVAVQICAKAIIDGKSPHEICLNANVKLVAPDWADAVSVMTHFIRSKRMAKAKRFDASPDAVARAQERAKAGV